ncbi:MAG: sensor histidine kinase, partial [Hyphomicrobiaceae bacterium]
ITDLLGYSRITTKAKPFRKVDLNEILEGVISDIQMRIEDDKGKVIVGDLPTFDADPSQMRQLFQNLLSNALKFKKPDVDPVVSVSADKLMSPGENGEQRAFWRIKVADNGIGFDNKHKDQIFTIFQRLHGRFDYEGTGIGLATCRKIVERHEGTLDADGVPDEGATFTVELPAVQVNKEEPL